MGNRDSVSTGTRTADHRDGGDEAEEKPPIPAVARWGVNSCSWKFKSSMGRLSARSGKRETHTGGVCREMRQVREEEEEEKEVKAETVGQRGESMKNIKRERVRDRKEAST